MRRWSVFWFALAAILCAGGIGLSVYVFTAVRDSERVRAVTVLENNCDVKGLEVRNQLGGGVTIMFAMSNITQLIPNMTNDLWNDYASRLISQANYTLLSFSRTELVARRDVASWERRTGLQIRRVDKNAELVRVALDRDLYLPIVNSYPRNARILGLDNLSEGSRKDVIFRGVQSKSVAVSDPFIAPNVNPTGRGAQKAFLIFLPQFNGDGNWVGGLTEAYFESFVVKGRFLDSNRYSFGIQSSVLFSDRVDGPAALVAERSFQVGDRTIYLSCGSDFRVSSAPAWILALGSALSFLLPATFLIGTRAQKNQRKINEAMERSENERQLWQLKNSFLNNVSHELKTPLNGVMGMVSFLLDTDLNNQQKSFATNARNSVEELGDQIDNVIDFSAIEGGQFKLEEGPVSLRQILDDIDDCTRKIASNGNTFYLRAFPPVEEGIVTDKKRLTKIIQILLSNAFKFTKDGMIEMRCSLDSSAGSWTFSCSVTDSGTGIHPDVMPNLAAKFQQANSSASRTYGGLGLGLTLASKLLHRMRGQLRVTSEVGRGSTFAFDIPVVLGQVYCSIEVETPVQSKTVLVVDDNDLNRKVLCKMLTDAGWETVTAVNGEGALEQISSHGPFSLIFMDIQMPVMDGWQASRELRKLGVIVPIIAVTANATSENVEVYREAGLNDLLPKPVRKDALLKMIAKYTGKDGFTDDSH